MKLVRAKGQGQWKLIRTERPDIYGPQDYETYIFTQRQEEVYWNIRSYHNEPEVTIGTEYSENILFYIYDFKLAQKHDL